VGKITTTFIIAESGGNRPLFFSFKKFFKIVSVGGRLGMVERVLKKGMVERVTRDGRESFKKIV
jgi:hypothetical protein